MTDRPVEGEVVPVDGGYQGSVREMELTDEMLEGLSFVQAKMRTRQVVFLRAYAVRGIITDGLRSAGVNRNTYYHWRENDPWFKAVAAEAEEEARDAIEGEAFRRAVVGYEEPVIYQGMPTMVTDKETGQERMLTTRKYSDALMAIMLKGARPERYRENHKMEIDAKGATGILVVPAPVSHDEWAEQARIQQQRYAGDGGE